MPESHPDISAAPATRRSGIVPMALWTLAILAILAVAWAIAAIAAPAWQVHRALSESPSEALDLLGGQEAAARKLAIYLRLPRRLASEQLWAVGVLGQCGPIAVPELVRLLRHEDGGMRAEAAEALVEIRDPRAFDPLVKALRDADGRVRRNAVLALRSMGDVRSVEPLIAALGDEDTAVRVQALLALGELGEASVTRLLAALENPKIRAEAAHALALTRDRRAVEPLLRLLDDEDETEDVRTTAAEMLGHVGDPRAIGPLVERLSDKGWVGAGAAAGLGRMGEQAVGPLIAALDDEATRNGALLALGQTRSARAVAPLVAALRDPEPINRKTAAWALGFIGQAAAGSLPELESLLEDEEDERVRKFAVDSMERIRKAIGPEQ
mgnify:CR=1 FL=1